MAIGRRPLCTRDSLARLAHQSSSRAPLAMRLLSAGDVRAGNQAPAAAPHALAVPARWPGVLARRQAAANAGTSTGLSSESIITVWSRCTRTHTLTYYSTSTLSTRTEACPEHCTRDLMSPTRHLNLMSLSRGVRGFECLHSRAPSVGLQTSCSLLQWQSSPIFNQSIIEWLID